MSYALGIWRACGFAFEDFAYGGREFVFAFSVSVLHCTRTSGLTAKDRESSKLVCVDWAELNNVRKINDN